MTIWNTIKAIGSAFNTTSITSAKKTEVAARNAYVATVELIDTDETVKVETIKNVSVKTEDSLAYDYNAKTDTLTVSNVVAKKRVTKRAVVAHAEGIKKAAAATTAPMTLAEKNKAGDDAVIATKDRTLMVAWIRYIKAVNAKLKEAKLESGDEYKANEARITSIKTALGVNDGVFASWKGIFKKEEAAATTPATEETKA